MHSDRFQTAAEGWRIISQTRVSREGARRLLYLLAEALNTTAAGIRFFDPVSSYQWEERVDRYPPIITIPEKTHEKQSPFRHPFPCGPSYWFFEGTGPLDEAEVSLLDLLAGQWLRLRNQNVPLNRRPKSHRDLRPAFPADQGWIAISRRSKNILSRLPALCHSTCPVLIIGEPGSGRTHLAELIHRNGPDPSAPFLHPGLAAEPADTGTLYIPDWQAMDHEMQSACMKRNERIIAAGNPSTRAAALRKNWIVSTRNEGTIVTLPALRDRKEDLPLLAGLFLDQFCSGTGNPCPELSPGAVEALQSYSWPGNVRELKQTLALVAGRVRDNRIDVEDLPPVIRGAACGSADTSFPERLAALEYHALREELNRQRGNMTRTAGALGLTPRQVSWRIRKYGIDPREFKSGRSQNRQDG